MCCCPSLLSSPLALANANRNPPSRSAAVLQKELPDAGANQPGVATKSGLIWGWVGALVRVGSGRAVGPGLRPVHTPQGFNRASAVSYTQFRSRLPTAMTVTTRKWSST